jgi:hypothetical protein
MHPAVAAGRRPKNGGNERKTLNAKICIQMSLQAAASGKHRPTATLHQIKNAWLLRVIAGPCMNSNVCEREIKWRR